MEEVEDQALPRRSCAISTRAIGSEVKAWWLDRRDREFTSPSFLIDRAGRFRWVHPGGTLAPEDAAGNDMHAAIEAALSATDERAGG